MNEIDKILLEQLKKNMDSLESSTIWIFITLLVVFFSSLKDSNEFEFANIKINKKYGGIILFGILCGLNFQFVHLMQNISHILDAISNVNIALTTLKLHPWIFNPFSETSTMVSYLSDYIGFPMLLFLWWFGFSIAQNLFLITGQTIKGIGICLFTVYLIFGLISIVLVSDILLKYEFGRIKMIAFFVSIILCYLFSFYLMKKLPKIQKLIQNEK